MRILPAVQNGVTSAGSGRRAAGAGGFSLDSATAPKSAAATGAALGMSGQHPARSASQGKAQRCKRAI
jgi:hypothetical protein